MTKLAERQPALPPPPETLCIDLTYACNLHCTTCRCPDIDAQTGGVRLSLTQARRAILEFAELGGESVEFFGGEPLLIKDIYQLVAEITELGLSSTINTNGLALTPSNAQRLIANGLSSISISIDGSQAANDQIRGAGAYGKALKGAFAVAEAAQLAGRDHFRIDFRVTVSRQNSTRLVGLVPDVAPLAPGAIISVWAATRVPFSTMQRTQELLGLPVVEEANHWSLPEEILIPRAEHAALRRELDEMEALAKRLGVAIRIDSSLRDDSYGELESAYFHLNRPCKVFNQGMVIGPDGAVGACPMLTHVRVAQHGLTSLKSIWNHGQGFIKMREKLAEGYLPVCNHCCMHPFMQQSNAGV